MKIRLLSEADVAPIVAELDFSGSGVRDDFLADPDCGPALRVYLALTDRRVGGDLSPAERFYNQYFWFCRFVHQHQARFGFDAGIEQQAFQILDRAECAEWELDVTLLEHLDAAARQSTK